MWTTPLAICPVHADCLMRSKLPMKPQTKIKFYYETWMPQRIYIRLNVLPLAAKLVVILIQRWGITICIYQLWRYFILSIKCRKKSAPTYTLYQTSPWLVKGWYKAQNISTSVKFVFLRHGYTLSRENGRGRAQHEPVVCFLAPRFTIHETVFVWSGSV